jgi:phage shock protein C
VNPRRLYRCRYDRRIAGVAAGMAEYLDLDPTLVRVLWVVSVFFGGVSILLYIILAFVMPLEPVAVPGTGADVTHDPTAASAAWPRPWHEPRLEERRRGHLGLYAGLLLVVFGALALVDALVPTLANGVWLGPALLVALGIVLLIGSVRRDGREPDGRPSASSKEDEGHATPA